MTFRELQANDVACRRALTKVTAELADTAKSLLNAVELAVKYQHERDAARATIARVEALCKYAADYEPIDFVEAVSIALTEPELKRWTVPAPATSNSELAVAALAEPVE